MKSFFYCLMGLCVILASCSQLPQMDEYVHLVGSEEMTSYDISSSEINRMDFSRMIEPKTKATMTLTKEITPVVERTDTLLYVINYGDSNGWVIASGDKRTPIILAMSETGHFDIDLLPIKNKGVATWFEGVKEDIVYLKEHPDFIPDSTYLAIWNSRETNLATKGGIEHEGEWLQLVYTMIDFGVLRYDIDHLMSTQWGQDDPWNLCLPLDESNDRCSAGCTIVAAAQQAYYLHSLLGKPSSAFQYGICTDHYYDNNYNPSIILYTSSPSTWATMVETASDTSTIGKQAVSALMGEVIKRSSATWYNAEAVASMGMVQSYFSYYSISCSSSAFNQETVLNNILNDKPVIVGLDSYNGYFGDHTAVIDGIKVFAQKITYYYQWMPIGTYPPVEPEYPDLEHPELYVIGEAWGQNSDYFYRLNWGFDGELDDGLYQHGTAWGRNAFLYVPDVILYNFN